MSGVGRHLVAAGRGLARDGTPGVAGAAEDHDVGHGRRNEPASTAIPGRRAPAALDLRRRGGRPGLPCMCAVQITRFGGPEVLDVVDLPDPLPGDGEQLYEVSAAGVNFADTHQSSNTRYRSTCCGSSTFSNSGSCRPSSVCGCIRMKLIRTARPDRLPPFRATSVRYGAIPIARVSTCVDAAISDSLAWKSMGAPARVSVCTRSGCSAA